MPEFLNYKKLTLLFFGCAVLLRILLFSANPPLNAFDDHFKPIFLIMDSGEIPAKNACFQCYQPPVFYWISALAGKTALALGVKFPQILKLLQFLPCLYSILTVGIIFLILRKLPLSDFSRLIAFGAVCFLPRDIYMSAMHSNDTLSYLLSALSVYLLIIAIERKLSAPALLAASLSVTTALFTKYTSFVLLPVVLIVFALLFYKRLLAPRKKIVLSFVMVILLPVAVLGAYMLSNYDIYGSPLPWNVDQLDPVAVQPHDEPRLDLLSFKPWESMETPFLIPGRMHSFWTLVYSGMWFDNEPKFLCYLDSNQAWWNRYYAWMCGVSQGEGSFPGENLSISLFTKSAAAGLIGLGLFPLLLMLNGFYSYFFSGKGKSPGPSEAGDIVKVSMFPALIAGNLAVMILLVLRLPVFSAMKASYFLASLPAFALFLGLGVMRWESSRKIKLGIAILFGVLFALVAAHILQISLSLLLK